MSSSQQAPRLTRRQVLAGAAGVAATTAVAQVCPFSGAVASAATRAAAAPAGAGRNFWYHAVGDPRGSDLAVSVGRDAEGRFGLMFKRLPAFRPEDSLLVDLSGTLEDPRVPGTDPSEGDSFDNPFVPAGFTFLGQFIDHDMTRDTTPLPLQDADPHGLKNFDSPVFDLQSVYGRGPSVDPVLYEPDGKTLRLVPSPDGILDLPRSPDGTAFIGDPRNDENHVVAQLHIAFMRLHNGFVASGMSFAEARRQTQWHFQWIIVNDYLPHIVGRPLVDSLLGKTKSGIKYTGSLYKPRNPVKPMMPLEYSVAAFRFGHSMIRPEYEMHQDSVVPIFGTPGKDLRGSNPLTAEVAADWNYFFEIPGMDAPDDRNMSRRMDTRLSLPLFNLPTTVVPEDPGGLPRIPSLAQRNLLRGKRLGLPAGQDVAAAMGEQPLGNDVLGLSGDGWGGKAPLWYYVLKEAEVQNAGTRLGKVGGRIVAETILGILSLDRSCYLSAAPTWRPAAGDFRMGDLLKRAGAV